jgi:rubrerythrin
MATRLIGASVWEDELYQHLVSHEDNERSLLVEYQDAAQTSQSPAFQYLASLIVDDEMRHHRVFRDLASALKTDAEMRPEQPAVPRMDHWGADPARVKELTERLLERERSDAKELHRLAGELKEVKDTTLWQLLVRLMEMDTAKHVEILDFVKRHVRPDEG